MRSLSLSLFLFLSGSHVVAAPPVKEVGVFVTCARPKDFSVGKDVALYEACVSKQEKFCEQNETSSKCKKILAPKKMEMIKTGPGSDTSGACTIQSDGSYKCEQEMVRFLVPEEVIQPLASPTGLPTLNEDGSVAPAATATPAGAPTSGAGTTSGTSAPPPYIPPPPPPGLVPNK